MNYLHITVISADDSTGLPIDFFKLPVPISAHYAICAIVPGEQHGPWDVPCGHDLCRENLDVAAACAAERGAAEAESVYSDDRWWAE